jgi:prolyl 4-hydroxylase
MNMYNFIEEYKMDKAICDKFIKYHKKNKEYKHLGRTASGINPKIKSSTDVYFMNQSTEPFIVNFFKILSQHAISYLKKYNISHNLHTENLNIISHYKKKQGYKLIHYERSDHISAKRQLVYMLYCNSLKKGGTYFPFQNKILNAVKGKFVLWPSDFTHQHCSIISDTQEKYIVTGWLEIV